MSAAVNPTAEGAPALEFKQVLGHPRPLWMLFMTEFWERFAFYGIRWRWCCTSSRSSTTAMPRRGAANRTYGSYLALVYAGAIFGGYVADRVLGYQRSILLGAIIMAAACS
jgi:POT family proton-dependent oligopeptide transporter